MVCDEEDPFVMDSGTNKHKTHYARALRTMASSGRFELIVVESTGISEVCARMMSVRLAVWMGWVGAQV